MSESGKINLCQALAVLRQGTKAIGFDHAWEVVKAEALRGSEVCDDDADRFMNKVVPSRYQFNLSPDVLNDPVRASQWIRENAESRPRLRKAKLAEILAYPEFSGNEAAVFSTLKSVIKNHPKIAIDLKEADDFVQECWVRIQRELHHFDSTKNSFDGFIYMIAPQVQDDILQERNRYSGLFVSLDKQHAVESNCDADFSAIRVELADNPLSGEGIPLRRLLSNIARDEKWFTFLLLHLRLEFIQYQQRTVPECAPSFSCKVAESMVLWLPSEENRPFLNWPVTLSECWSRIVKRMCDDAPQSIDVSWTISTILARAAADSSHKLHWNTSKKRCEEQLVKEIRNPENQIDAADARHLLRCAKSIIRCMNRKDAP